MGGSGIKTIGRGWNLIKPGKIWAGILLGVVVLMMVGMIWLNGAVRGGEGKQKYGMIVKKKGGQLIYFPDACAIKKGEGQYSYLTWIADKNTVVYASVRSSDCEGFYVCDTVPLEEKDFKFNTVTEAECRREVAIGAKK